jgi:hypothetical protein
MGTYKELPQNRDLAAKVVEADTAIEVKRTEMGWLGRFLGDSAHRPGAIAFITIVCSFVLLGVTLFGMEKDNPSQATAITVLSGLISASVGYLFGRSSSGGGD